MAFAEVERQLRNQSWCSKGLFGRRFRVAKYPLGDSDRVLAEIGRSFSQEISANMGVGGCAPERPQPPAVPCIARPQPKPPERNSCAAVAHGDGGGPLPGGAWRRRRLPASSTGHPIPPTLRAGPARPLSRHGVPPRQPEFPWARRLQPLQVSNVPSLPTLADALRPPTHTPPPRLGESWAAVTAPSEPRASGHHPLGPGRRPAPEIRPAIPRVGPGGRASSGRT